MAACASPPKTTPELSTLLGRKVALVEVRGEPTAAKIVEVALVNELVKDGTFELINKREGRTGAEFLLQINVIDFTATENTGYDRLEVEDSQLKAETGQARTERLVKVKSLKGVVRCEFQFTNVASGETRTASAEATETFVANEEQGSIRLPPRLRFLEQIAQKAVHRFFEENR